jgi:hypothetical protein
VIAGGHHVDAQVEKLFRERRGDSEASRGIFTVGDDQINGVLAAQFRQAIFYDGAPGAPKNVTDEKKFQDQVSGFRCQVSGTTLLTVRRERPNFDVITLKTAPGAHWQPRTGYWVLISAVFRKS